MRKYKIFFWLIILFLTVLPIGFDYVIYSIDSNFPIIWTIYILPCVLITLYYPSWRVIITSGIILSVIKYTVVIIGHRWWDIYGILMHVGSSILDWTILLTLAYFRIRQEKLLQHVNRAAMIDPLTGIYNRRYFNEYLKKAISSSEKQSLVLNLLDMDYFKRINDTYGHVCGDLALQHVSGVIKSNIRESDVLVRMGGEEFAVIFSDTSLVEGKKICERIREGVEKTEFIYQNQIINLTLSIGMCKYNGEQSYEFIDRADKALFRAKKRGRNQLVVA